MRPREIDRSQAVWRGKAHSRYSASDVTREVAASFLLMIKSECKLSNQGLSAFFHPTISMPMYHIRIGGGGVRL